MSRYPEDLMSMLDRYRKPGGFYQLLALVETCGLQKQEKFLEIIRAEDPRWADALRTKMIDINRIYSWNDETIAEIVGTLQDLTLAVALHAASPEVRARILKLLSHGRKRKIDDLFGTAKPSPSEVAAMHVKILETVRKMAHDGFLRFEKFDAPLAIEDEIEDMLNKPAGAAAGAAAGSAGSHATTSPAAAATHASASMFKIDYGDAPQPAEADRDGHDDKHESRETAPSSLELAALKKKLVDLSKENAVLRHELSVARTKLEQIKKIA